jgi:hypothetical protein
MNIGEKIAVICDESIPREEQRAAVLEGLAESGREIMKLTFAQLQAFAGNMLELKSANGGRVVAMSDQARRSLTAGQAKILQANGEIVSAPIGTIEGSAGGSVRCMLAEIHLPAA